MQDVTPPNLTALRSTPTAINTSSGPVTYTVTDLGTLPGYNESFARGINATGQVVGALRNSTGEFHAFIWDQTLGMQNIGTLGGNFREALAVNNNGNVVGASYMAVGGPQRAFLYSNGMMINLGDQSSGAEGINTLGEIVGYGQDAAFIWDSTSGFLFIGGTSASAINDLDKS
jgi:probable HAF family extracellular repeat protein